LFHYAILTATISTAVIKWSHWNSAKRNLDCNWIFIWLIPRKECRMDFLNTCLYLLTNSWANR
jgi:hypothetical protein